MKALYYIVVLIIITVGTGQAAEPEELKDEYMRKKATEAFLHVLSEFQVNIRLSAQSQACSDNPDLTLKNKREMILTAIERGAPYKYPLDRYKYPLDRSTLRSLYNQVDGLVFGYYKGLIDGIYIFGNISKQECEFARDVLKKQQ